MPELANKMRNKYKRALQLRRRDMEKRVMEKRMKESSDKKEYVGNRDILENKVKKQERREGADVNREVMKQSLMKKKLATKLDADKAKAYGSMANKPKARLAQNRAGAQSRLARTDEVKKGEATKQMNRFGRA